jgi:pilus assembly protein CpaE
LKVLLTGSHDQSVLAGLRERQVHAMPIDIADVEKATGSGPDAIVIDIRQLPGLPQEIAAIRRRFADAGIVILGRTLDSADLLAAMRMGANEWVSEPLVHDELVAAIRRVAREPESRGVGKVFAIVGAKGGVGSTTVAVNLATSMTLVTKAPALLIDLHPAYGDAAVFLGVEPRFSVVDALENIDRLDETYLRGLISQTSSGADLLASSHRLAGAVFDVRRLRRLLEVATSMYRHVVLDCPRAEPSVLEAIDAASQIVVVANQELTTLRSATRIVSNFRQRCGTDRVKVAMTRFDPKADLDRSDIEKVLGGAVHHLFPNDYQTSVGAITRGEPLIVANHSRLASSMVEFARQLGGFQAAKKNDAPKSGLFGRFGGRR